MSIAISETMTALCVLVVGLPIGTNLDLLHFMWMQLSGTLLSSRGGLFPALQAIGLYPSEVRRAWAAFRGGDWHIADLLATWEEYVLAQGHWQPSAYEGYYPKAVDLTAYWRPSLKDCPGKHYYPPAGKALAAVVLGLIVRVGQVHGQRVAVITQIIRADPADPAEKTLQTTVVIIVIPLMHSCFLSPSSLWEASCLRVGRQYRRVVIYTAISLLARQQQ